MKVKRQGKMLTFDGFGYGKSDYWHQVAVRVAKDFNENCSCWNTNPLEIKFGEEEFSIKIRCIDRKVTCKQSFEKTEKKIEEMFKKFYET
jgi:hypothetical protein